MKDNTITYSLIIGLLLMICSSGLTGAGGTRDLLQDINEKEGGRYEQINK